MPYALNAASVDGVNASELITQRDDGDFVLTQTNLESIFSDTNFPELQALLAGTSSTYLSSLPDVDFDMNSNKIVNVDTPTEPSDAANKNYVDTQIAGQQIHADLATIGAGEVGQVLTWDGSQWTTSTPNLEDSTKLPLAGGTMTGAIDMGNQNLTNANNVGVINNVEVGNNVLVSGGIGVANGVNSDGNISIHDQFALRLGDDSFGTSHYVGLRAPSGLGADMIWTLPATDGSANQVLQTDGLGQLSWVNQTSPGAVDSVFGRTGAVVAVSGDYNAGQISATPSGSITSTDVQGALTDLDSAKVNVTRQITTDSDSGLLGGGNLTSDLTLSVDIMGTTLLSEPIENADSLLIYDDSTSALRRVSRGDFVLSPSEVESIVSGADFATTTALNALGTTVADLDDNKVSKNGDAMTGDLVMQDQRGLVFNDTDNTNFVSLRAPGSLSGNVELTLPANSGALGQVLSTDGSGVLSWITPAETAPVASVFGRTGVVVAESNDYNAGQITVTTGGSISSSNAQGALENLDAAKVNRAGDTITGPLVIDAPTTIDNQNELRLSDSSANYVAFRAPASLGGNTVWTLPSTDGSANQVLQTDGLGVLSWVTPASGADDLGNHMAQDDLDMANHSVVNLNGGSAAAPALSFHGDDNTGIFSLGMNSLSFSTAGTEAMSINPSGGVGIGVGSAETRLHVAGSLKLADGGEDCSEIAHAGMVRYNSGNLYYCNGVAWQVLSTDATSLSQLNGLSESTQSLAVGTDGMAPWWDSAGSTHTLHIPLASTSGVTSGTISHSDYESFSNKLGSVTGSVLNEAQIWVGSEDNEATPVSLSGDASLTETGVITISDNAVTNSKINDDAVTTNKILNGNVTTEKLSDSGVTAGTYPKVTVDTKGRVTGGDVLSDTDIPNLDASKIVSGTLNNARLPADVAVNTVTLVNGIKIGSVATACDGSTEGTIRYNSTVKRMEFCNGVAWKNISSGTQANLNIGSPSQSLVKSGPVEFVVTYGSGTDDATIILATGHISLGGSDTSGCTVTGVSGSGLTRTVTVDNCTGTGTVHISVVSGTAQSTTGDPAGSAGPSSTYGVDNTGPTAPPSVTLGSVPSNLTNAPTISYGAASDIGGSTVSHYEVRVERTSDSSQVLDWTTHTSGNDVGGLSLDTDTQYTVYVRAVDALGNIGTVTAGNNWTTINDPCLGSPSPGTVCTGGAIYLGSLSPGATSGSGTDHYMTTPGGCNDSSTPTCSGTDSLTKAWYGSSGSYVDIPGLTNYTTTIGTGNGATNTDANYGSDNTAVIVAHASISSDSAADWCNDLVYGGYSDWYLPNRYELNLMYTNKASIPGLDTSGNWYWSSTEYNNLYAWRQRFSDGNQTSLIKNFNLRVRCVRRF